MNGQHPAGVTKLARLLVVYRATWPSVSTRTLAEEIGISAATLNRIERGHNMDADTLMTVLTWLLSR